MAVTKSRPTLLRPMRAVRLGSYDALDRWLAATDLNPNDDLHSVLPDDQAMCEIFPAILPSIGNFPPVYVLSFMAFHPRAGTTHILRLARFAGYPDAPDAPLWASRLTPGRFVYFPESRAFVTRLVAGLTDIPPRGTQAGPLLDWSLAAAKGTPVYLPIARHSKNVIAANRRAAAAERRKCAALGLLVPSAAKRRAAAANLPAAVGNREVWSLIPPMALYSPQKPVTHVLSSAPSVDAHIEAPAADATNKDAAIICSPTNERPLVVESASVSVDVQTEHGALVTDSEAIDTDVTMTPEEIRAAWRLTEETEKLLGKTRGRRNFVVKRRRYLASS
ncbi:hypothetical protein C8R44DRAFT_869055 [Mycena epipterygia]|nr:hypothetical protein C8R44DRAFT_869055 [Mycena epipterygia]